MFDLQNDLKKLSLLIVEDTEEYIALIKEALGVSPNFIFKKSIEGARTVIASQDFDLILLDISLPDGNGLDFMYELNKQQCSIPVIFLTGSQDISHKVMGLSLGAHDYVSKPFHPIDLAIRVKNKVTLSKSQTPQLKQLGNLSIDMSKRKVVFCDTNREIELTPKEFDTLKYFCENIDFVVSRQQILDAVWGSDKFVSERSVDTLLAAVRKKVKGWDYKFSAVYGVGYKLSLKLKAKRSVSNNVLALFETESLSQINEVKKSVGNMAALKKSVHKIHGSYLIFTEDLNIDVDQIYGLIKKEAVSLDDISSFINSCEKIRQDILEKSAA